jgi:hypothetical protein
MHKKKDMINQDNVRLTRNDTDQVLMNLIFNSLSKNVNISGANQNRAVIVLFYNVESITIYFRKISIAEESPTKSNPSSHFLSLI